MRRLYYISIVLLLSACAGHKEHYLSEEGMVWNTLYHISYESAVELTDSFNIIFKEIDNSLSPFNTESTLSKINDNRDKFADLHVKSVYIESRRIHKESSQMFDPTLAPIIRAWGFGQGHEVTADTLKIDSLLNIVGLGKTELVGDSIFKENPQIEFNFSALAKGYGVDCIAEMLERNGVKNYLVEIGGEIRAAGTNENGEYWSIGIDKPNSENLHNEIESVIRLNNASIATSGNYRNFHESGNSRFGHTISPTTGRPAVSDVLSASVVAPSCMEADALATCCMVLGSKEAMNLCTRLKIGVLLILDNMSVTTNVYFPDTYSY